MKLSLLRRERIEKLSLPLRCDMGEVLKFMVGGIWEALLDEERVQGCCYSRMRNLGFGNRWVQRVYR